MTQLSSKHKHDFKPFSAESDILTSCLQRAPIPRRRQLHALKLNTCALKEFDVFSPNHYWNQFNFTSKHHQDDPRPGTDLVVAMGGFAMDIPIPILPSGLGLFGFVIVVGEDTRVFIKWLAMLLDCLRLFGALGKCGG